MNKYLSLTVPCVSDGSDTIVVDLEKTPYGINAVGGVTPQNLWLTDRKASPPVGAFSQGCQFTPAVISVTLAYPLVTTVLASSVASGTVGTLSLALLF